MFGRGRSTSPIDAPTVKDNSGEGGGIDGSLVTPRLYQRDQRCPTARRRTAMPKFSGKGWRTRQPPCSTETETSCPPRGRNGRDTMSPLTRVVVPVAEGPTACIWPLQPGDT